MATADDRMQNGTMVAPSRSQDPVSEIASHIKATAWCRLGSMVSLSSGRNNLHSSKRRASLAFGGLSNRESKWRSAAA